MDWLDPVAVQRTLKSFLQHHSSKTSIPQCSAFFIVQLLHTSMTTGKTIVLTRRTFVGKAMSPLFKTLSAVAAAAAAKSLQSCLTLCDPMDCSTPDFPVLHLLSPRVRSNSCPSSR